MTMYQGKVTYTRAIHFIHVFLSHVLFLPGVTTHIISMTGYCSTPHIKAWVIKKTQICFKLLKLETIIRGTGKWDCITIKKAKVCSSLDNSWILPYGYNIMWCVYKHESHVIFMPCSDHNKQVSVNETRIKLPNTTK